MIDFRTHPPLTQKIDTLEYVKPQIISIDANNRICQSAPRKNGVIKMQLLHPASSLNQVYKYQARAASTLSLNGTLQHNANQIHEQFDFWGSTVSIDSHVFGTDISIKSTREFFIPTLNWLFDNVLGAIYPGTELEILKQTEVAALQRKMTTPKYWSNKLCMEAVFGKESPMTGYAGIEDISQLQKSHLVDYHRSTLSDVKGTWFLAGDTDNKTIDAIKNIVRQYSQNTPLQNVSQRTFEPSGQFDWKQNVKNSSQVSLTMAKEFPSITSIEFHKFALLNIALGGYFGSRLMQEIRENRGLTYGIGSHISQTTRGNIWSISSEMNSANAEEATVAINEIVRSMHNRPISDEELERAKRYYAGQFRSSFDGPFAMASKMRNLHIRGFDFDYFDAALDTIWGTTSAELTQLAHNYLQPETFYSARAGEII